MPTETPRNLMANRYGLSGDFAQPVRDLSDVLSTVLAGSCRFISLFRQVPHARQRKHEWLENAIYPRGFEYVSATSAGVLTLDAANYAKVAVGQRVTLQDDPAQFKVTAKEDSTCKVTVTFAAPQGSTITGVSGIPTGGGRFRIIALPVPEASHLGEETFTQSRVGWNATQIFRKDFSLSGTASSIGTYGNENSYEYQLQHALDELTKDLNRTAIYGARVLGEGGTPGEAGGLYYFGTQKAEMNVALDEPVYFSDVLVNDLAQLVQEAGGDPALVLCSTGQARVLSMIYANRVNVVRDDQGRGTYVAQIVNAINGNPITIMAEDIPDTEAWVIDPSGLGLSYLEGREPESKETTLDIVDGRSWRVLGELTLEWKNAAQRLARITGLMKPAEAVKLLGGAPEVRVRTENTTP